MAVDGKTLVVYVCVCEWDPCVSCVGCGERHGRQIFRGGKKKFIREVVGSCSQESKTWALEVDKRFGVSWVQNPGLTMSCVLWLSAETACWVKNQLREAGVGRCTAYI